MKRRSAMLSDICEINPAVDPNLARDGLCSFVPMEAVDDFSGRIERQLVRPIREVAKGYTPFEENDVIVAKITPCMEKGKSAIARNLRNGIGFGSTEFHVLRKSDEVIPEWLYYFWRYPPTRIKAEKTMRGSAGQKRVPADYLKTLEIPLPDLAEQKRIAAILERADRLRRLRRYGLEMAEQFLPAAFGSLFGDQAIPKVRWQEMTLAELVREGDKINYGVVQPGFDLKKGVPIVRVADLDNLEQSVANLKRVDPEIDKKHLASRLRGDELLIACVGSIGKVAKATPKVSGCNIARAVARIPCDWDKINRDFLGQYLKMPRVQKFFTKETRTVAQPTLNILQIEETPVITPPLELQRRFAGMVQRFENLRSVQQEEFRQAEHLFQTLLDRAFTSGL